MSHILEHSEESTAIPYYIIIVLSDGRKTHRCGYVGVPPGHFLHGKDYSENVPLLKELAQHAIIGQKSPILAVTAGVNAPEGETVRCSPDVVFDCHGGLTYAGKGYFVPVDSRFRDYWFFGFDCHHCDDGEIEPNEYSYSLNEPKSLEFCIEQCNSLAEQIASV